MKAVILVLFLLTCLESISQLAVTTETDPSILSTKITGPGIKVISSSLTGDPVQTGIYDYTGTDMGLSSGIIMSTGDVADAIGPNDSGSETTSLLGAGSPSLDALSGQTTYDAVELTFEFISNADEFSFDFVFASEEYNEFVFSINDVFAFYISGPGITGEKNLAVVPGTTTPITINTINNSTNPEYYVDNEGALVTNDTQFDGYTTVLQAATDGLTPCSVYTLRLVLADASDGSYDSAIFIEEGEFTDAESDMLGDDITFCGEFTTVLGADLEFTEYLWQDGSTEQTLTVSDYGTYSVTVKSDVSSFVCEIFDTIRIIEYCDTDILAPIICSGELGSITIESPLGSYFEYSIDGGVTWSSSNVFSDLVNGDYTVLVRDSNTGYLTDEEIVTIDVRPVLVAEEGVITNVDCNGESTGAATINIVGGLEPYVIDWDPDVGSTETVTGLAAGDYTVLVTDDNGCTDDVSLTIQESTPLYFYGQTINHVCGSNYGSISTNVVGGQPDYMYEWEPGVYMDEDAIDLTIGEYELTITDALGCQKDTTFIIDSIPLLVEVSPIIDTIIEFDSIQLFVTDGYYYDWTPVDDLTCIDCNNPVADPTATTVYEVLVYDDYGCYFILETEIEVIPLCGEVYIPDIFSPNNDGVNDYYRIYGRCIEKLNFQIFNRWGEVVFTAIDTDTYWDGMYKGKIVENGSYAYQFSALMSDGSELNFSGNINVVR